MTTNAFLGGIVFEYNDQASPEVWQSLEEINDMGEVGESTPLVQVTHFGSTSQEYIGGLADGDEFSVSANRVQTAGNVQDLLIGLKGLTRVFRLTHTDSSVSPNTVTIYTFSCVILGWSLQASIEDKNSVTFNFKISGGVVLT